MRFKLFYLSFTLRQETGKNTSCSFFHVLVNLEILRYLCFKENIKKYTYFIALSLFVSLNLNIFDGRFLKMSCFSHALSQKSPNVTILFLSIF